MLGDVHALARTTLQEPVGVQQAPDGIGCGHGFGVQVVPTTVVVPVGQEAVPGRIDEHAPVCGLQQTTHGLGVQDVLLPR